MTVRYYSSVAPETTLSNTINNAAVSITVGSTVGFPALTPYTLALDYEGATEELVQVNSAAGNTLTIARAIDGTSATGHNAGARVRHVSSARDFADSRTHENSDQGIHGLSPSEEIVGTEKVQTLTNKTLSSPAFTGSFTGTLRGGSAATDRIRLDNATDASPTSTGHALQVGLDTAANIRIDGDEIMAANNGVAANLGMNSDGGAVNINSNVTADNATNALVVNGAVDANAYAASRASSTAVVSTFKADADSVPRYTIRADGRLAWGPGGSGATDVALSRSGIGTLQINGNLSVDLGVTADDIHVSTLTVTNLVTLPKVTNTSAATAQTGWSISSAQYVATAGVATVQLTVTRTGGNIVAPSSGNLSPDIPLAQLGGFALPNSAFSDLHFAASNFAGVGAAVMTSSGIISLQSWTPGQTIATGDNVSIYLTYVQ